MGKNKSNGTGGIDFATNEYFFEFHRRIVLQENEWKEVMDLMSNNKFDEAKALLKEVGPRNALDVIELFLTEIKNDLQQST